MARGGSRRGAAAGGPGPATLADLAAEGIGVFCWCNRCSRNAVLPVAALIPPASPGTPVPELGPRLRCRRCGARDASARPAWPSQGVVARHARA
jgi:hypothetical protein